MKIRKQKVISRILCMVVSIFLLASFFVVPVAALDQMTTVTIQNILYEFGGDDNDPDQRPYSSANGFGQNSRKPSFSALNNVQSGSNHAFDALGVYVESDTIFFDFYADQFDYYFLIYYINQVFDDGVTRNFSQGDTFFIENGHIGVWTTDPSSMSQCRFVLRDFGNDYSFDYGRVVAYTDVFDINVTEDGDGIDYDRLSFNFREDVTSDSLCLCVEFLCDLDGGNLFQVLFEQDNYRLSFGPGVSPNYPIYPSAPGGDDIGHLDSQEQQLLQDSQAGLDAGVDVMENTGNLITDLEADLNLVAFTGALNQILNRIVLIPGLDPLVHISLSLGLFASLFGLAASIISAASHRSGQAASESKRESRKK